MFRYLKGLFRYLKILFRYLWGLFRYLKGLFRYLKILFRYLKGLFSYLKIFFRYLKGLFRYLKDCCYQREVWLFALKVKDFGFGSFNITYLLFTQTCTSYLVPSCKFTPYIPATGEQESCIAL